MHVIVAQLHPVRALLEQLAGGEPHRHPDCWSQLLERAADPSHALDVLDLPGARCSRKDEVRVLGHPEEAQVHLAEQRPALEQERIAEGLPERPEEPGQVEVLLDQLRLQLLARRSLATQLGQEHPLR